MLRIAIGDMRDKVNQVSEGDNAILRRRGGRLQEDLALVLILAVLAFEVVFVGAAILLVQSVQE